MISCIIKKHRLSKSEKFDHQYLNPLNLAAIMLININCKGEFAICLPQTRGAQTSAGPVERLIFIQTTGQHDLFVIENSWFRVQAAFQSSARPSEQDRLQAEL